MMCIGTNESGEIRTCFCYSRQCKGCDDSNMRIATDNERKNYKDHLDMFW